MCAVVWPLTYAAALHPATAWTERVVLIGMILWPTQPMLMAIQPPGSTIFSVAVTATAVIANGILYGLLAMLAFVLIHAR
jgi:hypothetical protein